MKRGLTAAFTTWLALVALQTFATSKSSPARVAGLFQDLNSIVERALDPSVPAIPDRREGAENADPPAKTKTTTKTRTTTPSAARTPLGVATWRPV